MANLLGIVLFALGICLTVALHEAGHMLTARAFGMRVRRFFIGFGPTLWSFKKTRLNTVLQRCLWAASATSLV